MRGCELYLAFVKAALRPDEEACRARRFADPLADRHAASLIEKEIHPARGFRLAHRLLEGEGGGDGRQDAAPALLGRLRRDFIPALELLCERFRVRSRDTAHGQHRHNPGDAELHRFLYHEIEFVELGQTLVEHCGERRLRRTWSASENADRHALAVDRVNHPVIVRAAAVAQRQRLAGTHAQGARNMTSVLTVEQSCLAGGAVQKKFRHILPLCHSSLYSFDITIRFVPCFDTENRVLTRQKACRKKAACRRFFIIPKLTSKNKSLLTGRRSSARSQWKGRTLRRAFQWGF